MTRSKNTKVRALVRDRAVLLALLAVAAVAAPAAAADRNGPIRTSLELELNIYDQYLTEACGTEVVADLSGLLEKKVVVGKTAAHEVVTFNGQIRWIARNTGTSYSSSLVNRMQIEYPEGIELWKPARVTVIGRHGGTFPIGGGPAGKGTLVYDATVYAVDDEGFPYWFVEGDPISMSGNFERETQRICAALT